MKKLLLTLGSTAAIVAPVASTIACSDAGSDGKVETKAVATYSPATKVLSVMSLDTPEYDETDKDAYADFVAYAESLADVLNKDAFKEAISIVFTGKHGGETLVPALTTLISEVYHDGNSFANLGEVFAYDWEDDTMEGFVTTAKAQPIVSILDAGTQNSVGNEDASDIEAAIEALTGIQSSLTYTEVATLEANTVDSMLTTFELTGITAADFNAALTDDWVFVRADGLLADENIGISIVFEHKDEMGNSHYADLDIEWTE